MPKRYMLVFVALILVVLVYELSSAGVFDHMTYQGVLTQNGSRVNGPSSLTFKIYNAQSNGTLKWSETQNITIQNGILNVVLGDSTTMSLDGTEQYWLEIWVGTEQLGSRVKLSAVPYSMNADRVDSIHASRTPQANKLYPLDSQGTFTLTGSTSNYIIKAENNGTGYGISASAHGTDANAVEASADGSDGKAIYGYAGSTGSYAIYGNGLSVLGNGTTGQADALHVLAPYTNNSATWALEVLTKKGSAIYAWKTYDDLLYTAQILAQGANKNALYVYGNFVVSNGTKSAVVKTSAGYEPLFCMESPEVEFYSNGTAQLISGTASVSFSRLFSEAISSDVPVRVILTPAGSWSGMYIENVNSSGFTVRSETGNLNASFNWLAIGRRNGYEQTPKITVPDLEETEGIKQQKEAALKIE
jgi:hypothetical protein